MYKQKNIYSGFIFFLFLSVLLFVFSHFSFFNPITSFFQTVFSPVGNAASTISHSVTKTSPQDEVTVLKKENKDLLAKLVSLDAMQKENAALKDQFKQQDVLSTQLIP